MQAGKQDRAVHPNLREQKRRSALSALTANGASFMQVQPSDSYSGN